jgi:hypothetical protein
MRYPVFIFGIFVSVVFSGCTDKKVNLEKLLNEMTDRTELTYFPENNYKLKQFSSYDRNSVSPDSLGWFANADYTQFIREEQNAGRREFVLLDADGPGAVVRWWMTFSGPDAFSGTMRVYIDGSETPVIEGNILEMLSGTMLAVEPLASSVSPETVPERRGHNLYLPIPYAKQCKITYECDAVKIEESKRVPSIYYNICYRVYEKNVDLESFSKEVLKRAEPVIRQTAEKLLAPFAVLEVAQRKSGQLAENDNLTIDLDETGKAISRIAVKLQAEDLNQALRSTVLEISFDGNQTVWIPAGEFFGTGYQLNPSKTWFTQVNENGWMEASWLMPFKKSAEIRLVNYGSQKVNAEIEIGTEACTWKNSSMYFGASWHEFNQIYTAKDDTTGGDEWHFDMNYVTLNGQGIYVGDAVTVFNTVDGWWGEGDEKIFVDGEKFPSSIGTGSEDYYGYAWCRPEKFSHPFIAQPVGDGSFTPGMSVNMRYRALDAIPFQTEINSNIEMWHWVKTRMNYAQSAFWYAKPGFTSNDQPDQERVKIPVATRRTDIYKPVVDETGKLEGEFLEVVTRGSGAVSAQSGSFGWSRDSQLWWRNAETGSELITKFILNKTGKFKVTANLTKAVDYGIIQLYINGIAVGPKFDGYIETGVKPYQIDLGTQVLSEGDNILTIKILGANKNAQPGNMAGIDWLQFDLLN